MRNASDFGTRNITEPPNIDGDGLLQHRSAASTAKVAFSPMQDLKTRSAGRGRRPLRPLTAPKWASLLAFVLLLCLQGPLPTEARTLSQSGGVHYEDCELVASAREVQRECGHQIQPSAVAYLPTYRRLLVVGQEYILHATEDDNGKFERTGCYKGDDLSLGRGDIESATALDFALQEPPKSAPSQRHENWRRLKTLDQHILVMEETYAFRGAYLVDTSKLGNGRRKDDDATVHKLAFPKYLRGLEGLAFVPDLTDDEHLGTLFLGSQRRRIMACKLPLANLDKEVECGDDIRYPYSIDSMEFDPTFEVVPGKFGALVIGSDPRRDAVYVDPWALAEGRLEMWSDRFRMASGSIDGVELKGREGHAIYGNKAFYALDESRDGNYGAIVCRIENKPKSSAKSVSGWHIPEPSSEPAIKPPTSGRPSIDGDSKEVTIQGSSNEPFPGFPESFDIMMYNVTPGMVARQWMLHQTIGDGKCGSKCENEKAMMSMLYPRLALQLRCRDRLSGKQDQRHSGMDSVCDDDAQMGTNELVTLAALPDSSIINNWMAMARGKCDKVCAQRKAVICKVHPELGKQLRCDDLRKGRDNPGTKWKDCKEIPKPVPLPDSSPVSFSSSQTIKRWDAHGVRECGPACQVDKRLMCLSRPRLCWKLRCQDIEVGVDAPVIDCQKKPPSLPEKIDHSVHSAPGYCTYTKNCDGGWGISSNGWCNAGMGNCAVSCQGMWCFTDNDKLQPVKLVKPAGKAPSSTNDNGLKKPAIGPASSPASPGPEKPKSQPATAALQTQDDSDVSSSSRKPPTPSPASPSKQETPGAGSSTPAVPKWTWKAPSPKTDSMPLAPSPVPKWTWTAPSPKTAPRPSAPPSPAVPKWTWKAPSPKAAPPPPVPSPAVPEFSSKAPSPKTAPPPSAPSPAVPNVSWKAPPPQAAMLPPPRAALSVQATESTIVEDPAGNAASTRSTKWVQDDASSQATSGLASSISQSPIVWIEQASSMGISVYTPSNTTSKPATWESKAAEWLFNKTVSQNELDVEIPTMDSTGILSQEKTASGDARLVVESKARPLARSKRLSKHPKIDEAEDLPIVPPLTSQPDTEPPVIPGNSLLPGGTGNGQEQSPGSQTRQQKRKQNRKIKEKANPSLNNQKQNEAKQQRQRQQQT